VTLRVIVSPESLSSLSFFFSSFDGDPPIETGDAAPRLVPGAIAAKWLA
jgi:hypothetical protein